MGKRITSVVLAALIALLCVGCGNEESKAETSSVLNSNTITTVSTTLTETKDSETSESEENSIKKEFQINTDEELTAFLNKAIKNAEKEEEFKIVGKVEPITELIKGLDEDEHRVRLRLDIDGYLYLTVVDSDAQGIKYFEFGASKVDQYTKKWNEYDSIVSKERNIDLLNKLLFAATFYDREVFPKNQRTKLAEKIINYIYKNYNSFQVGDRNYYSFNFRFDDYVIGISVFKETAGEFEGEIKIFSSTIDIYPYIAFEREHQGERIVDSSEL